MFRIKQLLRGALTPALCAAALLALSGCPTNPVWNQAEYDRGFDDGFMVDEEYWLGFDDSYDTRDFGPIYYSGSEIPIVEEPAYDAGYWDGVWYAYNDGYFVQYDYAFTVGFSEGYDVGFRANWIAVISADEHPEHLDGGWSDGYNDGFSEGLMLGATDYDTGLPFDWLDAMFYYREGNDVYLEEVDRGTGEYGPVWLYEYGTDPNDLVKKATPARSDPDRAAIRRTPGAAKADTPDLSYRVLTPEAAAKYNTRQSTSPRAGEYTLSVSDTTWLERVQAYRSALGSKSGHAPRDARRAVPAAE